MLERENIYQKRLSLFGYIRKELQNIEHVTEKLSNLLWVSLASDSKKKPCEPDCLGVCEVCILRANGGALQDLWGNTVPSLTTFIVRKV